MHKFAANYCNIGKWAPDLTIRTVVAQPKAISSPTIRKNTWSRRLSLALKIVKQCKVAYYTV